MDRRAPVFKYRLASLLKLDQWEGGLLGVELRRARHLLEEKQRLQREIDQRIGDAQAAMRDLHRDDAHIPREKRRVLAAYLDEQYAVAATRSADLKRAEQLFEQIMAQRVAKQKRIRALENHREREQEQHDTEQERAGQRAADELWLITRR